MKITQRHSGQSLVEFALIFPIVFFLITGFFDLGRAVFYYSSLNNAVREATRYAIVNKEALISADDPTYDTLQKKVIEYAFGMSSDKMNIIVTVDKDEDEILFTTVTIQATYLYEPIIPCIKGIQVLCRSTAGISITARSKMLVTPGSSLID